MECSVHFAFHGCGGSAKGFGEYSGYNILGALNNIIMVYPDTRCWDHNRKIDKDYGHTRYGLMPTAIKAMIDRITASD